MDLTIVIPALNEEQAIADIIERSLAAKLKIIESTDIQNVHITVVDDGSTDDTKMIAEKYPEINLISFGVNRGYGAAIKAGFAVSQDEYVGFLDADGTCDPLFFIDLFNFGIKNNCQIVLGSRLGKNSEMPAIRYFGNRMFSLLISMWSGQRIVDVASGMRLIRRDALEKLYPLPDGLHFTPAMSAKAIFKKDMSIGEIPMSYKERTGESKLKVFEDGLRFLKTIIENAVQYYPRRAFSTVGAIILLFALFLVYPVLEIKFSDGSIPDWMIYRMIIIVVLINASFLIVGVGFIAQNFLDIIHYKKKEYLSKFWFFERLLINHGLILGFLLLLFSAVIFFNPLQIYIETGTVSVHWMRFMIGGLSFTLSIQAICFGVLGVIFYLLKQTKNEIA